MQTIKLDGSDVVNENQTGAGSINHAHLNHQLSASVPANKPTKSSLKRASSNKISLDPPPPRLTQLHFTTGNSHRPCQRREASDANISQGHVHGEKAFSCLNATRLINSSLITKLDLKMCLFKKVTRV